MDFKTKRKIVIMRKFSHQDLAMIGGFIAIIAAIMFNLISVGTV